MIIVDANQTVMLHFENIDLLQLLPTVITDVKDNAALEVDSKVRLIASVKDNTVILGEYSKEIGEYIFSSLPVAVLDDVKVLYLPASDKSAGVALLEDGASLWGLPPAGGKHSNLKKDILASAFKGGVRHEKTSRARSN